MKYTASFALVMVVGVAAASAADDKPKGKPDDVFGMTKVHEMHLTIQQKDWDTMQPTRGGFGGFGPVQPMQPPPMPKEGEDRKPRGGFSYDFAYVKAQLEVNGTKFKDIGVRFKGNSTWMSSNRGLNRPFKIDFDRYDDTLTYSGVKKISLNNHVMDPTVSRDVLAYEMYRAAGLPSPRTAYVMLTLTIPGKYDKELIGLYTMVEAVDKTFLKDRFGSAKGLLLKPERVGPLDYLGEDWKPYEEKYQPKTNADEKAQKRLIELTKLIHRGDDAAFRKQIGDYLDTDYFLRYMAVSVLLSSMDTFMGIGHNYYLYLDPKTNKFNFIPWDCDHAFGGFAMMGTNELMDLSIKQPQSMKNRLIERLFSEEKVYAAYKGHLETLLKKNFTVAQVKKDTKAIDDVIAKLKEKEQEAAKRRKEGGMVGMGGFGQTPDLTTFVTKRVTSVEAQLAGKSNGTVLANRFGGPGGPGGFGPGAQLMKPLLEGADGDKDGKLTKDELIKAAKTLFEQADADKKGSVDEKALVKALDKWLPAPPAPPGGGGFRFPSQAENVGKGIVLKAGKDGKVTEKALLEALEKAFGDNDKDNSGKLDDKEIPVAINLAMPPPQMPVFGPEFWVMRPLMEGADGDKDGKLTKDEIEKAAKALFAKADPDKKGSIDEKTLARTIDAIWPQPPGGGGGFRFPTQADPLAKGIMARAGKEGKVSEKELVEAALKLFAEADKDKDGKLDDKERATAIQQVMPAQPRPGQPMPPPMPPKEEKK